MTVGAWQAFGWLTVLHRRHVIGSSPFDQRIPLGGWPVSVTFEDPVSAASWTLCAVSVDVTITIA